MPVVSVRAYERRTHNRRSAHNSRRSPVFRLAHVGHLPTVANVGRTILIIRSLVPDYGLGTAGKVPTGRTPSRPQQRGLKPKSPSAWRTGNPRSSGSGLGHLQVTTDLSREELVYLSVPGNGCNLLGSTVHVQRVLAAFPQQLTPGRLEMTDEVTPFQSPGTSKDSRITSGSSPSASSRRSRFA